MTPRRAGWLEHDWVISSVGLVTAAGNTPADLHHALCAGQSLRRSARGPAATAGLESFNVGDFIQRRRLKDLSRTSQLACAAASLVAPGLAHVEPESVGISLGCGWGSLRSIVDFEWETCRVAPRHVDPLLFAETVPSVPAGQISIMFGWSGAALTVSSGGASGIQAIHEGIRLMEDGHASLTIAGGTDEINEPVLRVLSRDGILAADDRSLPCGMRRSGLTPGEGACLMVLESRAGARSRGARPLARVKAALTRFVGGRRLDCRQQADFLRELLARAELAPDTIDLVSLAANGSPSDREEAAAVHDIFGGGPNAPLVMCPKAVLGETWAASGPLGAAAAIECLRTGFVPGLPAGFVPDPDLPPLRFADRSGPTDLRHALILAQSHHGHLAGLLIAAEDGQHEA